MTREVKKSYGLDLRTIATLILFTVTYNFTLFELCRQSVVRLFVCLFVCLFACLFIPFLGNRVSYYYYIFINRYSIVDSQSPSILVRSRKSPGIIVGLRVVYVLFPVAKDSEN